MTSGSLTAEISHWRSVGFHVKDSTAESQMKLVVTGASRYTTVRKPGRPRAIQGIAVRGQDQPESGHQDQREKPNIRRGSQKN